MRFPNHRLAQLFTLLQNETLPQDELARWLSVSTRTVRADITALNALRAIHAHSRRWLSAENRRPGALPDPARACAEAAADPAYGADRINFLLVRF